jgi:hypothetical protein
MAKDKLTEYSATNASNDVLGDISVAEGMLPSAVNNAIREQMTHLKNFADGTDGINVLSLEDDDGSHAVKLQAPSTVSTTVTYTLPGTDGTSGYVLTTNGSGALSWAASLSNVVEDTSPQLGGDLDTNGNDINFGDNDKATFGDAVNGDLRIYHDGTQSIIEDVGTGPFRIRASSLSIENAAGTETLSNSNQNGAVTIYYDGSPKIATTATGTNTTGISVSTDTVGSSFNQFYALGNGNVGGIRFGNTTKTNGYIYYDNGGNMNFHADGSEKFRITSAGSVGISTSAPESKLHVHGSFRQTGATAPFEWTVNSGALDYYKLNAVGYADNLIVANSGGNVGIGTASPTIDGSLAGLSVNSSGTVLHVNDGDGATLKLTDPATGANRGLGITLQNTEAAISNCESGPLRFGTGNAERMRIGASGSVGIGTVPKTFNTVDGALQIGTRQTLTSFSNDVGIGYNHYYSSGWKYTNTGVARRFSSTSTVPFIWQYAASGSADAAITWSEAMRIDSNGSVLLGTTDDVIWNDASGEGIVIYQGKNFQIATNNDTCALLNRQGSDGSIQVFARGGTQVGRIDVTASATAYVTSSDRRLKSNIEDAASASDKIDAIQVRQFDWNVDNSHQEYGLIAQELQPIEPLAVSGNADSDEMMGVDYSKLVPMLIKEIQELRGRVAALEAN